jgi:hypothetical protein
MKKAALLFSPLAIWCLFSFSPKKEGPSSFEGIITYTVSKKLPRDTNDFMMNPITSIVLYVKGDMRKQVEITSEFKDIVITNIKEPYTSALLEERAGHKFLVKPEDGQSARVKKYDSIRKANTHFITTNETKEIMGYNCRKIIMKEYNLFNHDTSITTYYYTDKFSDYMGSTLPGLPMEFNRPYPENIVLTVTSMVKQSLPDSTFVPSSEYISVTWAELQKERMKATPLKPSNDGNLQKN